MNLNKIERAMKKYQVKVMFSVWDVFEVEAESEAEAMDIAEDIAGDKSLNEMNNEWEGTEIVDANEVED